MNLCPRERSLRHYLNKYAAKGPRAGSAVTRRLLGYMSNYDANQIEWLLSEIECFIQRPALSVPSARWLMFALNRS